MNVQNKGYEDVDEHDEKLEISEEEEDGSEEDDVLDEKEPFFKDKQVQVCETLEIEIPKKKKTFWKFCCGLLISQIKPLWLWVVVLIYTACGVMHNLLYKFQNESHVKYGTLPPLAFKQPIFQTFQMFSGMMLCCLIPSWVKECCIAIFVRKRKIEKRTPNKLLFMIPAVFDILGATLNKVSLLLTFASITMMVKSSGAVFAFALSIIFLKRNFYMFPHKWVGVFITIIGLFIAGASTVVSLKPTEEDPSPFGGAVIALIGCLFSATFLVCEEWLLHGYETDPLEVPGYGGFWGLQITMMILFLCYLIPGSNYGTIENLPSAFFQFFSNYSLAIFILSQVVCLGIYNFMGNVITLHLSCATRQVVGLAQTSIVWAVQVLRGRQEFSWMQLAGYIVLFVGVLIYNRVAFEWLLPKYASWCVNLEVQEMEKIEEKAKLKARGKVN